MANSGGKELLAVNGLTVEFESAGSVSGQAVNRLVALSDVSFHVDSGEIVGLVGESGCGKSLTGLAIMGLLPRTARVVSGEIDFQGVNLLEAAPRTMRSYRGRRVAMVFQEPMVALNPLMRVGRQIEEVLAIHGIGTRRQRRLRAVELLRDVGLSNPVARARQYPHELSGGMRQRVMIAMALAAEPALIVADEPTTALDVTVQAQVLELLGDIRERYGAAVLLITHDMGVVAEVADRVVVMYAGRVVESAGVDEIFHRPQHPYTQGLLASIPSRAEATRDRGELPTIAGQVPELGLVPRGCAFASRCNRAVARCENERPVLESPSPGHLVACWRPAEKVGAIESSDDGTIGGGVEWARPANGC